MALETPSPNAPFPTFLGVPLTTPMDVESGTVVVSGAPWQNDMQTRTGTRSGPNGIRSGSYLLGDRLWSAGNDGLFDVDTEERVPAGIVDRVADVGDFTVYPTDAVKTLESVADGAYKVVKRGGFSIVFGGNHYVSYPAAMGWHRAAREENPDLRIGYVHFDGHLDFGDYVPTRGTLNGGTNARRISELPGVNRGNMVWIGITALISKHQYDEINAMGGLIFTPKAIHEMGAEEVAQRAAQHALKDCDVIYCTVDIDVVDPGYLPGTGAADPSGISPAQLRDMLKVIAANRLGAADVMEVAPRLDISGRSQSLAAEMTLAIAVTKLSTM